MYSITGATGNTGEVVARTLLDSGEQVRVIGRSAEHLRQLVDRGAEPVVADLTDTAKLIRAFKGAKAVYAMIPPNPSAPDVIAYEDRIAASLTSAVVNAEVPYVVSLSSVGAELPSGTGLILGLRHMEQAFDRINGLNTLHLRAVNFMENTLQQTATIRATGNTMGPIRADQKLAMIAARDIGAAAALALLQLNFHGHQTRELQGQRDISFNEVTAIIGKAIGRPSLKYTHASDDELRPIMTKMGLSPSFVDLFLEMSAGLNTGYIKPTEARTPQNTTITSFESFVAEKFMPAYQELPKAA